MVMTVRGIYSFLYATGLIEKSVPQGADFPGAAMTERMAINRNLISAPGVL